MASNVNPFTMCVEACKAEGSFGGEFMLFANRSGPVSSNDRVTRVLVSPRSESLPSSRSFSNDHSRPQFASSEQATTLLTTQHNTITIRPVATMNQKSMRSMFQPLVLLITLTLVVETAGQSGAEGCGYFDMSEACPAGCNAQFQNQGDAVYCTVVPPGFYSEKGHRNFLPCDWGTYNPFYRAGSCLPCPPGTFADNFASLSCQPCPPNAYANENGQKECKPCDSLYYSGEGANNVIKDPWGLEFCDFVADSPSSSPSLSRFVQPSTAPSQAPSMIPTNASMTLPPATNGSTGNANPGNESKDRDWGGAFVVAAASFAAFGAIVGAALCTFQESKTAGVSTMAEKGDKKDDASEKAVSKGPIPNEISMENEDFQDAGIVAGPPVPQHLPRDPGSGLPFASPPHNEHIPHGPAAVTPYVWNAEDEESGSLYPAVEESKVPDASFESVGHGRSIGNRYDYVDVVLDDLVEEELNDSTLAIISPRSAAARAQDDSFSDFGMMAMSPIRGSSQEF